MDSKFFNGILVLLFPDGIFKQAVKDEDAFKPLISLLFSAVLFSSVGLYLFKNYTYFNSSISVFQVCWVIFSTSFIFILLTAAVSGLLNWSYSITLRFKKRKITSDFLGNFCTHAYTVPIWMFLLFLHIVFYSKQDDILFITMSLVVIIRLLDIEARLIKAVYKIRLIQGYVLVFMQTVLFLLGSFIGYALSRLIAGNS